MARFGQGVNASLGKTNYSNYLAGALQGAKGVAAGGSAIGQGIANLGEQVGAGIKQYYEKKEAKEKSSRANNLVKELIKKNPAFIKDTFGQDIDPTDEGLVKTIVETIGVEKVIKLKSDFTQAEEQKTRDSRVAGIVGLLEQGNGSLEGSGFNASEFDQQNLQQARSIYANNQFLKERIGATSRLNLPTEKAPTQMQEYVRLRTQAFREEKGREPTAQDKAGFMQQFPRSSTNINVDTGAKVEDTETSRSRVARNVKLLDSAAAGVNTMRKAKRVQEIINSGDVSTGFFAKVNLMKNKLVAAFGGEDALKKASATELTEALLGSEVFQLFQQLGVGARGLDTPGERDFMIKVLTGDITMQKKTILDMAKRRFDEGKRGVEQFNSRVKGSEGYRNWVKEYNYDIPEYQVMDWDDVAPIDSPESQQLERDITTQAVRMKVYNPTTGELDPITGELD